MGHFLFSFVLMFYRECRKKGKMKRSAFLSLVCVTFLLATGVSSILAFSNAHAAQGASLQMFSGTFTDQNLSTDGITKITLISIPFSVSTTGKLEATSLMNVYSNGNNGEGKVSCELDVDTVSFFSVTTALIDNMPTSIGLTRTTTGIASGNHTLAVKCLGSNNVEQGTLTVHSGGTSVIMKG